jgi:hypothetical protein
MAGNDLSGRESDSGFIRLPAMDIAAANTAVLDLQKNVPRSVYIFSDLGDWNFTQGQIPIRMGYESFHHFHFIPPGRFYVKGQ